MTTETVFSLIGKVVAAGGGGALIAFLIFRLLGTKWIENVLAKDLEAAKMELSLLVARKLKLHDREYVVFPEMWAKLNKAYRSLGKAVMSFREHPDFAGMGEQELEVWLERSDLTEDERSYFDKEKDKNRVYGRILDWRDMLAARADFLDFQDYLQNNRIFLSPEIKDKVDEIGGLINSSWIDKKMDFDGYSSDAGKSFLTDAFRTYEKQAKPMMTEIEQLFQSKLFPDSNVAVSLPKQ